jgi:hypothetical protein
VPTQLVAYNILCRTKQLVNARSVEESLKRVHVDVPRQLSYVSVVSILTQRRQNFDDDTDRCHKHRIDHPRSMHTEQYVALRNIVHKGFKRPKIGDQLRKIKADLQSI